MSYKVMGIDPSSTIIGVSLADEQGKLLSGMLIKPSSSELDNISRVFDMAHELKETLNIWRPEYIAIETPATHVAGRIKKATGMAIYGFGAGVASWVAHSWMETQGDLRKLKCYEAQRWTRGKPKKDRAQLLAIRCRLYKRVMSDDPGYDVAEAIQLAEICLKELQIEARMPKSGTIAEKV